MSIKTVVLGVLTLCAVIAADVIGALHMIATGCSPWLIIGTLLLSNAVSMGIITTAVSVWTSNRKQDTDGRHTTYHVPTASASEADTP